MFFRIFQHLLPKSKIWGLTIVKPLREFFIGFSNAIGDPFKQYFDDIFLDTFAQTTRHLSEYESQFALLDTGLNEQERRDRLAATWAAKGGQDITYIQDTLQAAGFDVYLHEWWIPGSEPPINMLGNAVARNPFIYLSDGVSLGQGYSSADGTPSMQDGNPKAQDGVRLTSNGYPLVNKVLIFSPIYIGDGSPDAQDGNPNSQVGGGVGGNYNLQNYIMPADTNTYPSYVYIGAQTFPAFATIPLARKSEFETLCMKICPAQLWLGILVNFT